MLLTTSRWYSRSSGHGELRTRLLQRDQLSEDLPAPRHPLHFLKWLCRGRPPLGTALSFHLRCNIRNHGKDRSRCISSPSSLVFAFLPRKLFRICAQNLPPSNSGAPAARRPPRCLGGSKPGYRVHITRPFALPSPSRRSSSRCPSSSRRTTAIVLSFSTISQATSWMRHPES